MAYLRLHSDPGFNFTLNRLAQTIPAEEVRTVAAEIDSLESWISTMLAASERAEQEGRYAEAARYLQGAEFYMKQGHAGKHDVYQRSIELINRAIPKLAEARDALACDTPRAPTCAAQSSFSVTAESAGGSTCFTSPPPDNGRCAMRG